MAINILPRFYAPDEMDKLFPVLHAPPPMENAEDWLPEKIDGRDESCGKVADVPGYARGEDRKEGSCAVRRGAAERRPPGST